MSETFRVTLDNMPVARIGDAWWDCRDDPPSRLPKSYFTDALDALATRERELAEAERAMREVACPIENCEDQEAKFICFNENADAIIEADTLADAISQIARCWELESERAEALRARLAARERDLAEARKSAASFEQEAAYRAQNTDYWQGIAEQARADLSAVEAVERHRRAGKHVSYETGQRRWEALACDGGMWNVAATGDTLVALGRALLAREAGDAK